MNFERNVNCSLVSVDRQMKVLTFVLKDAWKRASLARIVIPFGCHRLQTRTEQLVSLAGMRMWCRR